MKKRFLPFLLLFIVACKSEPAAQKAAITTARKEIVDQIAEHYKRYSGISDKSISLGSVGNGSLKNGRIVPFSGTNFHYFDSTSYLKNRCFVHEKVLSTLLRAYKTLETSAAGIQFGLMECSRENGGRIRPHLTHQNGLSVDFMTPLKKDGKQCTAYDFTGAPHYLMQFDERGAYTKDPAVSIDFETMALHLLALIDAAKANGLAIEKVILKLNLKDDLYATVSGRKLKASGIYFASSLTPIVNQLHDDHFHVDFKLL